MKEKKKKEKKRKQREENKRERERKRERRKGERNKEKMKAVFRRSECIRPRSKVHIFAEGCASRCRDSSYLGFFLSFELLFWSALGPRCVMFMASFVVLIGI